MRKFLVIIILFFVIVSLTACQLTDNYITEYGFTNEVIAEPEFEATSNGLKLEIPFADFSCDPASFKVLVDKKKNNLIMTIAGTETEKRCYQKFYANMSGIKPGDYQLKVVYKKDQEEQVVLYESFTITK